MSVPTEESKKGQTIRAEVVGQIINLETDKIQDVGLRLSDELLDLDKEITVNRNGRQVFQGTVQRSALAIYESLHERLDPSSAASVHLKIGE